jgi:hypothetical protein
MGYFLSTQILIPKITLLLGMMAMIEMAHQTKVMSRKDHHILKTPRVQPIFIFFLNIHRIHDEYACVVFFIFLEIQTLINEIFFCFII